MPRQHKADAGDDTYICDTDGYRLQAGCYYSLQLPDGRALCMLPPTDPVYDYFGPVVFGPYHSLAFSIDTENWASGQDVKPRVKKQPEDTEEHGLYWGSGGIVWHLLRMAMAFRATRASGRTFLWMPCYEGGLKLGDSPCLVDQYFGDNYYPLLHVPRPKADSAASDKQFPEDFEVQFVYQGDIA